jgi:hypothetical protein
MERDGTRLMAEVKRWLKISLVAAFVLAAAPSAWARIYVKVQAPEVRVETHEERKGFVWQSGYWQWRNQKHEWSAGHYAREQKGRHWTDGRWEHDEHGHYYVNGRWER